MNRIIVVINAKQMMTSKEMGALDIDGNSGHLNQNYMKGNTPTT